MDRHLVNPQMEETFQILCKIYKISNSIYKSPFIYIKKCISDNKLIGKRELFWTIKAMNTALSIHNDYVEFDDLPNSSFLAYIIEKYEHSDLLKDKGNHDFFWAISFYQALYELKDYTKHFESKLQKEIKGLKEKINRADILTVDIFKNQLKDLNKEKLLFSKKHELIKKKFKEIYYILIDYFYKNATIDSPQQFYLNFWVFSILIENDIKLNDKELKIFFDISSKELRNNISYYHCSSPKFNQIFLSMAANSCHSIMTKNLLLVDKSIKYEIHKAQEICYNIERKFFEKRFILELREFKIFTSIPFEDVYILSRIKVEESPYQTSIFDYIVNYIEQRLIKYEDLSGITFEGSIEYPNLTPYITSYFYVLLSNMRSILKFKLKNLLIENIGRLNDSYVKQPTTLIDLTKDVYDTQENTIDYIVKKINKSHILNNSILLFGPPGTGKTSIVEGVLDLINKKTKTEWTLITFGLSLFLTSDSYSYILREIELLFDILIELEDCVFFFDEAEELIRKREDDDLRLGRMFTAAMLLFLNRIKLSKSYFIFATNFIEKMDDAAIRKGRFAIRKGIGCVSTIDIEKFVKTEFNKCNNKSQVELVKSLKNKPIKELLDIKKEIFMFYKTENLKLNQIKEFFKKRWKPYLSKIQILNHIKQCKDFDDTYI